MRKTYGGHQVDRPAAFGEGAHQLRRILRLLTAIQVFDGIEFQVRHRQQRLRAVARHTHLQAQPMRLRQVIETISRLVDLTP